MTSGIKATPKDVTQFGVYNDEGYITFTEKFKYLGSLFNADLRDNQEIAARINKANQLLWINDKYMAKQKHNLENQGNILKSLLPQHHTVGV
jgi:hypothetical protein